MTRRSPRKKPISPKAVVESDDEDLVAVASDASDQYVALLFFVCYPLHADFVRNNRSPTPAVELENDDDDK